MFKYHPRLTTPGYAEIYSRGYGFGQFDAGHRAASFMADDVLKYGDVSMPDYRTINFNYTTKYKEKFSVGINPWKRTIIHIAPQHIGK